MANPLPPVPYKIQVLDRIGYLSPAWVGWFREAFARIGGSVGLTLPEIQDQLTAVQNQANALQDQLNSLSVDENYTELNQGPVL